MKVGLFSPYLLTMGGGERYFLTTAEFFLRRGDQVDIFWSGERDLLAIYKRFNIDLTGVNFRDDIFFRKTNFLKKLVTTAGYDLLYFLSDGSIPTTLAKKNIVHFQVPFSGPDHRNLANWLKLRFFQYVVCNSEFTKKYIDRSYGVESVVIYPPVPVHDFSAGKKERLIVSVGRFVNRMHPKKHKVMISEFIKLYKGGLHDWRLVLIGGTSGEDERAVSLLRERCRGFPIKILANCGFSTLRDYYSRAAIYWHAAGYGEDLGKYPEKAEHFGMTTVEAMSAGAVPIIFAGGGQKEIVTEEENGFLWETTGELRSKTLLTVRDEKLRVTLSRNAIVRAQFFSKERFFRQLDEIC